MKNVFRQLRSYRRPGSCGRSMSGTGEAPHSFRAEDGKFMLDGKPFQIISGEMHYRADSARVLARTAAHGEGDGAEHDHDLRVLELS